MRKSDQVLIAEINDRAAMRKDVITFLTDPVISILVGYVAIEGLQKANVIPDMAGNIAETGILVASIAKASTPALAATAPAAGDTLKMLPSLLPLLLAAPK